MKMLCAEMTLSKGIHHHMWISFTRGDNGEMLFSFLLAWTNSLIDSKLASDLKHHDIHVIAL